MSSKPSLGPASGRALPATLGGATAAARQSEEPPSGPLPSELPPGPVRRQLLALIDAGGEAPEQRRCPGDGAARDFAGACRAWLGKLGSEDALVKFWRESCTVVPKPIFSQRNRVLLLMRHGSRPDLGHDPSLDSLGFREAKQAATYLADALADDPPCALFASPYLRTLQTAQPLAEALGLPIRVEWGFGELLARGWLQREDPLPVLQARGFDGLPMRKLLHPTYKSAEMPVWPDFDGRARPGDIKHRERAVQRHRRAAEAALAETGGGHLIVICHGSTHDFVVGALCPEWHPPERHTPACVPNCGITMLVEQGTGGGWWPACFGGTPWKEDRPSAPSSAPARVSAKASPTALASYAAASSGASAAPGAMGSGMPARGGLGRSAAAGAGRGVSSFGLPLAPSFGLGRRGTVPARGADGGGVVGPPAGQGFVHRPIWDRLGAGRVAAAGSFAGRGYVVNAPGLRPAMPAASIGPSAPSPPSPGAPSRAGPSTSTSPSASAAEAAAAAGGSDDGEHGVEVSPGHGARAAASDEAPECRLFEEWLDVQEQGPPQRPQLAVPLAAAAAAPVESDAESDEVVDLCVQCEQPAGCHQQADDGNYYCDRCWHTWTTPR